MTLGKKMLEWVTFSISFGMSCARRSLRVAGFEDVEKPATRHNKGRDCIAIS